jgi:hypothetical protein
MQKSETSSFRKELILVEIVARTCKRHLQELWREKMFEKKVVGFLKHRLTCF